MDERTKIATTRRGILFLLSAGWTKSALARKLGRNDVRPLINGEIVLSDKRIRQLRALCAERAAQLFSSWSFMLTREGGDPAEDAATRYLRDWISPALHQLVQNVAAAVEKDTAAALFAASMRAAADRLGLDPQRELFREVTPEEEAALDLGWNAAPGSPEHKAADEQLGRAWAGGQ